MRDFPLAIESTAAALPRFHAHPTSLNKAAMSFVSPLSHTLVLAMPMQTTTNQAAIRSWNDCSCHQLFLFYIGAAQGNSLVCG